MTRIAVVLALLSTLLFISLAGAAEFKGVTLPDQYELAGQTLQLNGQGMRKKFFDLCRCPLHPDPRDQRRTGDES